MAAAKRIMAMLLGVMLVGALVPMPASAYALEAGRVQASPTVLVQKGKKAKTGWVKTKTGKKYYRKGVPVVGLQRIKGSYYYFSARGVLRTRDITLGRVAFYIGGNGKVFGAKNGTKYYYRTLKRMPSLDAYNFKTYLMARKIVNEVTSKHSSKSTKMRKVFDWAAGQSYHGQSHDRTDPKWIPRAARCLFSGKGGNCVAYAASLAYLLTVVGYDADVCSSFEKGVGHTWTMVGNRVYDACYAAGRGYAGHYGASLKEDNYVGPGSRYDVPLFNPAHASRKAKVPKALLNAGKVGLNSSKGSLVCYEKGKMVRNAWRTIQGKRYYFKASGKAATGSSKVKGVYYVFSEKGVLQNSTVAGLRIVTVSSQKYRVDQQGRAVSGWSADGMQRFSKRGKLMCGVQVEDGVFYAATSQGVYLPDATVQLREAGQPGSPAAPLRVLLDKFAGAPKSVIYSASCIIAGDDGLWSYASFYVMTVRPKNGIETISSITAS